MELGAARSFLEHKPLHRRNNSGAMMGAQSFLNAQDPLIVAAAAGLAFLLILWAVIALRVKRDVEVRPSDVLVAVAPIILLLLASGYISKASFGPQGVEFEAAARAIVSSAKQATTPLDKEAVPFTQLQTVGKGSPSAIPAMIENKVPVLTFMIGRQDYYTPEAVREYFQRLRSQKFLRYIVFQDSGGMLAGICQASPLIEFVLASDTTLSVEGFVQGVASGSIVDVLTRLDFCEGATLAVAEDSDRGEALKRMQAAQRDWLPVVDKDRKFAGVVDRSNLLANLVLDVVQKLNGPP
jgi:hypothetical protein